MISHLESWSKAKVPMVNIDLRMFEVAEHFGLNATDCMVYFVLASIEHKCKRSRFSAYQVWLSEKLGVSKSSIKRSLKRLNDAGFVEVEVGLGFKSKNFYRLNDYRTLVVPIIMAKEYERRKLEDLIVADQLEEEDEANKDIPF